MSHTQKPDTERILGQLKDFQRRTVDYVYHRLYEAESPAQRFLIADEVGLGKTMVAKGVIARAVDRLWMDEERRIDVLYICSNGDVARQNINRLNFANRNSASIASRMTLLPLQVGKLRSQRLNFVSFTPGTSFNLRSAGGIARERALLYHLLRSVWGFGDTLGPKMLLRGGVDRDRWLGMLDSFLDREEIDSELEEAFHAALAGRPELRERFRNVASSFSHLKHKPRGQLLTDQYELIGELRALLARCCLHSLEPDIIILDEFQRFKDLLSGTDEVAQLAHHLFNYHEAKLLLLSATPYKMYTLHQESADEDHYRDFVATVRFLQQSDEETARFEEELTSYRQALYRTTPEPAELQAAKAAVEDRLRRVMVRSERLGATASGDGMLVESLDNLGRLEPRDLQAFALVDRVAKSLGATDPVEYWKSAPYLLNLMDRDGYKLKQALVAAAESGTPPAELPQLLQDGRNLLLSWERIRRYEPIDPANAKLRKLMEQTVDRGAWRLLWMPPSLPYYRAPGSPFEEPEVADLTKALVFSSWQVVPKAMAMLLSYEAERRMVVHEGTGTADYVQDRARRRPLIRFSRRDGYLTGMFNLTLLYPSQTLARAIDPMGLGCQLAKGAEPPSVQTVTATVADQVQQLLEPVLERHATGGDVDNRWFWAAPLLLDAYYHRDSVERWFNAPDLAWGSMVPGSDDEGEGNFAEHIAHGQEVLAGKVMLGRPPQGLTAVLAKVALASPAVTGLRALLRLGDGTEQLKSGPELQAAAARIALGFRGLFNMPESISLIRSLRREGEERYWESVLDYGVAGHLQAVLDEYLHILQEGLGLFDKSLGEACQQIAAEIQTALSLRTVSLEFDEVQVRGDQIHLTPHRLRCRFALRFGDGKEEEGEGGGATRADQVRKAFNSPFRPFVLASTSVGQEGLDFHPYCHQIYHWNLPSNPVDLEQREGRIHRYKGHVIRRNVAATIPLGTLVGQVEYLADPWKELFTRAATFRQPEQNDLVPYWVFENGPYQVVRHVPALPLSREVGQMEALRRTLGAYRMVFGQPRQEDLLAYLRGRVESDQPGLVHYQIDLSPVTVTDGGGRDHE